jgi:hypothetical protein
MMKQFSVVNLFVLGFFIFLVFFCFRNLFSSYFEADDWFQFTYFLPIIHSPDGFFTELIRVIHDTRELSAGQHLTPVATEIFFLDRYFAGLNYTYYVVLSLFFHSLNSFFVYYLLRELLVKRTFKNTLLGIIGGVFFALNAVSMQSVTWVACYGQNILSVTFFLLCLIFLLKALETKKKRFLFLSSFFLIIDLLTKEISFILVLIIPLLFFLKRNNVSWKLLLNFFGLPFLVYIPYRLYPMLLHQTNATSPLLSQAGGIIPLLIYRAITYPLKMISEIFFSRLAIQDFISFITPFIYPQYGEEGEARTVNRLHFLYGPGNDLFVYLLSFLLIILFIFMIRGYIKNRMKYELQVMIVGISILVFSALPLLFIVFSIPTWGFDSFFESRHYYPAAIGAALIFPLLLVYLGQALSLCFSYIKIRIPSVIFIFCLFLLWLLQNMSVFNLMLDSGAKLAQPRIHILNSLKQSLPTLTDKTVFYSETNKTTGQFGEPQSILPFDTNFAQILSVIYFDDQLPPDFYQTTLFPETGEGYKQTGERGFGYFRSKKVLSEELLKNNFTSNDVVSFYYDPVTGKTENITKSVRTELKKFVSDREQINDWKKFQDASTSASFLYPPETEIINDETINDTKVINKLQLYNPSFSANLTFIKITPTITLQEIKSYFYQQDGSPLTDTNTQTQRVFVDPFHSNESIVTKDQSTPTYLIKINEVLIYCVVQESSDKNQTIEKILGSLEIKQ